MHGKPISVDPYYGMDCKLVTINELILALLIALSIITLSIISSAIRLAK